MAKFTSVEKIQAVIRFQSGTEGVKSIAKSIVKSSPNRIVTFIIERWFVFIEYQH